MKHKILDVEWNLLVTRGSVDEEIAYQMAFGVRKLFDTDYAISTTGFADSVLSAREDAGLVVCWYLDSEESTGHQNATFR